jgi:predicted enzyme related to lactoylglutathione lyase
MAKWRGRASNRIVTKIQLRSGGFLPAFKGQPSKIMSAKKSTAKSMPKPVPGKFCWNELVASNPAVAKKFYRSLFGWKSEAFGQGMAYTLFKNGKDNAGGMMKCPTPGGHSHWLPYVIVKDVDATVKKAKKLGAEICVEPFAVPTVGRIAVLCDPQGAAIGILAPEA